MGEDTRSRAWYRSLLDSTSDVIAVLYDDGEIEYVNGTIRQALGYEPDELVGRSAFDLVHDDDLPAVVERFLEFTDEDGPEHPTVVFRFRRADGEWAYVETTGRNTFRVDGTEFYVASVREVSERHRRRQELAKYETIVENTPVGMFTVDEDGVITWANDEYAELLGSVRSELVGMPMTELLQRGYYDESLVDDYLGHVRTLLSSDNDVESVSFPVETHLPDGETRIHQAHVTLLPLEDGEFRGTVTAYRDVTKRRTYEAELERQNERLDRFASTVSHDLRNPLSVARGRTQLAMETGDDEHLERVQAAHDRMERLVEGLLELARDDRNADEPRPVSIADAAEAAWESVDGEAATLAVAEDATVVADPNRLRQVLENLFRNAIEHGATGDEGLTVTVGALADREGFVVEDDGSGVPPEARDRLFEHGYSTADGGTGFGLDIVETVAADHGWTVSLAGGDGGARFVFETDGETDYGPGIDGGLGITGDDGDIDTSDDGDIDTDADAGDGRAGEPVDE